jgi:hypothetical protein
MIGGKFCGWDTSAYKVLFKLVFYFLLFEFD